MTIDRPIATTVFRGAQAALWALGAIALPLIPEAAAQDQYRVGQGILGFPSSAYGWLPCVITSVPSNTGAFAIELFVVADCQYQGQYYTVTLPADQNHIRLAAPAMPPAQAAPSAPPTIDVTPARLDALETFPHLGLPAIANMQGLYDGMKAHTAGPDALFDPDVVNTAMAGLAYMRFLLDGADNPYSLQKIADGKVIALNSDERRELQTMFAQLHSRDWLDGAATLDTIWPGTRSAIERAGPRVRYAVNSDEFPLSPPKFSPKIDFSGLDRAQTLAAALSHARAMQGAQTVLNYSAYGVEAAELLITQALSRLSPDPALATKALRMLKVLAAIQLTQSIMNDMVCALVATTPNSISSFYMTINNRKYERGAPPWSMQVGGSAIMQIYVVPHSPGGSCVTPLGAANYIAKVGEVPFVSKWLAKTALATEARKAIWQAYVDWVALLGRYHYNTASNFLNSTKLVDWAKANQQIFVIAPFNSRPVAINDPRVVKLTPGIPIISIGVTPDWRYTVNALRPGMTGITGSLGDDMRALWSGGVESTQRMAIQVIGEMPAVKVPATPPPSVQPPVAHIPPMPVIPPSGPALPQPTPPQQAEQPAWTPCGKPEDGGTFSPYTHKCEYPK